MAKPSDVLCAGIIVADHVCTPVHHLPAAGELVLADPILLTVGAAPPKHENARAPLD
jgi:hypothetical protein